MDYAAFINSIATCTLVHAPWQGRLSTLCSKIKLGKMKDCCDRWMELNCGDMVGPSLPMVVTETPTKATTAAIKTSPTTSSERSVPSTASPGTLTYATTTRVAVVTSSCPKITTDFDAFRESLPRCTMVYAPWMGKLSSVCANLANNDFQACCNRWRELDCGEMESFKTKISSVGSTSSSTTVQSIWSPPRIPAYIPPIGTTMRSLPPEETDSCPLASIDRDLVIASNAQGHYCVFYYSEQGSSLGDFCKDVVAKSPRFRSDYLVAAAILGRCCMRWKQLSCYSTTTTSDLPRIDLAVAQQSIQQMYDCAGLFPLETTERNLVVSSIAQGHFCVFYLGGVGSAVQGFCDGIRMNPDWFKTANQDFTPILNMCCARSKEQHCS